MGYIKERVSYLKGLIDGIELPEKSKEGRLISAIADILDDMADSIELSEESIDEINENLEAINEDLEEVETTVQDCLEEICALDDCDCDCNCDCKDVDEIDDIEDIDDIDDFVEFACPECGDTIYFDPEFVKLAPGLNCPNCGKPMQQSDDKKND